MGKGMKQKIVSERLIKDISSYLDDLITDKQLHVSIHRLESALPLLWHRFLAYNTHNNPYCTLIKTKNSAWQACLSCQGRALDKAKTLGHKYQGVCWAGVNEAVFPIRNIDEEVVAFISISGYREEDAAARLRVDQAVSDHRFMRSALYDAYETLDMNMTSLDEMNTAIAPLQYMFTLLILEQNRLSGEARQLSQYQVIEDYIMRHFTKRLTLTDLADEFHFSYTSLSRLLSQHGTSFTELLKEVRLDAAKKYLLHTDESITLIALNVGYPDANYFSTSFSKAVGMNPTKWRIYARSMANK